MAKTLFTLFFFATTALGTWIGYENGKNAAGTFGGAFIGLILGIGIALSTAILLSLFSPTTKRSKKK